MKTRKFEIIFDNAGGALLMTRRFCHFYDDGKRLAQDVREILNGADVSAWDGCENEFRRGFASGDARMDQVDVKRVLSMSASGLEDYIERLSGYTQSDFVEALCAQVAA